MNLHDFFLQEAVCEFRLWRFYPVTTRDNTATRWMRPIFSGGPDRITPVLLLVLVLVLVLVLGLRARGQELAPGMNAGPMRPSAENGS